MKKDNNITTALSMWKELDLIHSSFTPQQTINLPNTPAVGADCNETIAELQGRSSAFNIESFVAQLPVLTRKQGGQLQKQYRLGEGGMGQVDLFFQPSLGRDVAVKQVLPKKINEKRQRLLLHESFVSGALEHPGVIPVHMLGRTENNQPALVMRRVEGVSWEELLQEPEHPLWERKRRWSDDPLVGHIEILIDLCNVVEYAHSRGFVHRDLKPENVMLGEFGEVYLLDWGLAAPCGDQASLTNQRMPFSAPATLGGTPSYMAPEMILGELKFIDVRTDVFLLGSTLHRILTGSPRHLGDTVMEALMSVATCAPYTYSEEIPEELAFIANRATSKDPKERFQTVHAFRNALSAYLRHLSSNRLSDTAIARLQQLQSLIYKRKTTTPHVQQIVRRLFSECRFGFLQALEAWPDNPIAQKQLHVAVSAMVEFEIQVRHIDNALALFAELERPSAQLSAQLDALHQELLAEENERTRIKQLALDFDFSIGREKRSRLMSILGLCVGLFALSALFCIRMGWMRLGYDTLLGSVVAAFIVFGGVLWKWKKTLFSNKISRQFVSFLSIAMSILFFGRLGGWVLEVPLTTLLLFEFLFFGLVLSAASFVFSSFLLWGFPLCITCFLVGLIWRSVVFELFTLLTFMMWFFPAYVFHFGHITAPLDSQEHVT